MKKHNKKANDETVINVVPNSDGKIGTDCGYILIPEQNINYDYIKDELSDFDWINDMDKHLIIVNILSLSLSTKYTDNSFSRYENEKSHLDIIVRDIFRRESRKSGDDVLLKDKCYEIINSIKTKNFILAENISDNELYSIIKEKYTNSEMKEFILYIRNILKNKFEKLTTKDISYITERVNTIAHITSNESSSPHSDYLNLYQNAVEYMGFLLQRYDEYGSSLMTYFSCIIDAVINSNTTEEQRNKMRENIGCSPLIKGVSDDSKKENNNQMDNYRLPEDDNDENIIYKMVKKTFDETDEEEFKLYMKNVLLNKYEDMTLNIINEIVYKINVFRHINTNRYYTIIKSYTDLQEHLNSLYIKDNWLFTFCSSIVDIILTSRENTDSKNISWGIKYDEDKEEHKFFPGEYEKPTGNNNRSEIRACQVNGGYYGIATNIDMNDTFKNYENEKINNIKIKVGIDMDKVQQPRNRIEMIDSFLNDFRDFLITKNKNYGDSALRPINVFNKLDSSNSITVRIDDKLSRIINSDELRENDCQDLFGYLILYCISEDLYFNNDAVRPEGQKTEDKIGIFINVFRKEIKEKYIDILKDLNDTHQPFAKLITSKKIGMELDNLICKLKGSKKIVKDDILLFMILLVSIILENGWTDMKKFID